MPIDARRLIPHAGECCFWIPVTRWYSAPNDPLTGIADLVRGFGIVTGGKSQWVIPCILIGVGLTVTGYLIRGNHEKVSNRI
jgi:hypothetical protein